MLSLYQFSPTSNNLLLPPPKEMFFCLFTVYSVWSTAMHVFRSHTVSALSDLAKKTFLSEIVKYFNCLEFRKTWENKLLYPIDNIFQLSNRKSEISNSREHQLMFFYLYLFENSASVTHLSCFSVFVHLEFKRKLFHSLSWNYTRSRPQQSSSTLVFKPKGSENIFIFRR